jgi:hypothetical protein
MLGLNLARILLDWCLMGFSRWKNKAQYVVVITLGYPSMLYSVQSGLFDGNLLPATGKAE